MHVNNLKIRASITVWKVSTTPQDCHEKIWQSNHPEVIKTTWRIRKLLSRHQVSGEMSHKDTSTLPNRSLLVHLLCLSLPGQHVSLMINKDNHHYDSLSPLNVSINIIVVTSNTSTRLLVNHQTTPLWYCCSNLLSFSYFVCGMADIYTPHIHWGNCSLLDCILLCCPNILLFW